MKCPTLFLLVCRLYTCSGAVDKGSRRQADDGEETAGDEDKRVRGDVAVPGGLDRGNFMLWADATVPFIIDGDSYDEQQISAIISALHVIQGQVCVRFEPIFKNDDVIPHVFFENKLGKQECQCINTKMEQTQRRTITLGYDCMSLGQISHQVMHILGFGHEHNNHQRDMYIKVMFENILPDKVVLYTVQSLDDVPQSFRDLPYDLNSVTHFGLRDNSKNGRPTIYSIVQSPSDMGHREQLSDVDRKKVQLVYGPACVSRTRKTQTAKCKHFQEFEMRNAPSDGVDSSEHDADITDYIAIDYTDSGEEINQSTDTSIEDTYLNSEPDEIRRREQKTSKKLRKSKKIKPKKDKKKT